QGFVADSAYTIVYNGVAWTLCCEVFFYLLLPFVLRSTDRWAGRPRLLVAAATAVVVFQLAFSNVSWRYGRWLPFSPFLLPQPIWHLPEFLVGVLLGRAYLARRAPAPGRPAW